MEGSFWDEFGEEERSEVDKALERGKVSLQELLCLDEIIQDTKGRLPTLIAFLKENARELATYIAGPPAQGDEDHVYRFPYMAAQVVSLDVDPVVRAVVSSGLDVLCAFATAPVQLPEYRVGYWAQVMLLICKRAPTALVDFFRRCPNVPALLARHMSNTRITAVFTRLLALPFPASGPISSLRFCDRDNADLSQVILNALSASPASVVAAGGGSGGGGGGGSGSGSGNASATEGTSEADIDDRMKRVCGNPADCAEAAAEVVKYIAQRSYACPTDDAELRTKHERYYAKQPTKDDSTVLRLWKYWRDDSTGADRVVEALMPGFAPGAAPKHVDACYGAATEMVLALGHSDSQSAAPKLLTNLAGVISSVMIPVRKTLATSQRFGRDARLGLNGLSRARFLLAFSEAASWESITDVMVKEKVLPTLLQLMVALPYNNMYHRLFMTAVHRVVSTGSVPLLGSLLHDGNLLSTIIDVARSNGMPASLDVAEGRTIDDKRPGCKIGFMGHLVATSNLLLSKSVSEPGSDASKLVNDAFESHPLWWGFVDKELAVANIAASALIAGQAPSARVLSSGGSAPKQMIDELDAMDK